MKLQLRRTFWRVVQCLFYGYVAIQFYHEATIKGIHGIIPSFIASILVLAALLIASYYFPRYLQGGSRILTKRDHFTIFIDWILVIAATFAIMAMANIKW